MLYSIKNRVDLEKIEELVSLQNQLDEKRLQDVLGKQNFHQDMKTNNNHSLIDSKISVEI